MKTIKKRTLTLAGKVVLSLIILTLFSVTVYFQRQNIATTDENLKEIRRLRQEVKQLSDRNKQVLSEFGITVDEVDP